MTDVAARTGKNDEQQQTRRSPTTGERQRIAMFCKRRATSGRCRKCQLSRPRYDAILENHYGRPDSGALLAAAARRCSLLTAAAAAAAWCTVHGDGASSPAVLLPRRLCCRLLSSGDAVRAFRARQGLRPTWPQRPVDDGSRTCARALRRRLADPFLDVSLRRSLEIFIPVCVLLLYASTTHARRPLGCHAIILFVTFAFYLGTRARPRIIPLSLL